MKYLVKLLFVIILPLVVSISSTYLVISNWEHTSVIGFCIAYDRNAMRPTVTIVAPFLIIEIQPRRK